MWYLDRSILGYIAGIVDGEGCISIERKYTTTGNVTYSARFNVVNTYVELLDWLKEITSKGIVEKRSNLSKDTWKNSYVWRLRLYEIIPILEAIMPYLIVKKKQAEISIEFISKIRHVGSHYPLTEEEKAYKYKLYFEMSILNSKGR